MSEVTTIGLDLAKNLFQVHALMHRAKLSCVGSGDVVSFCRSSREKIPVSWALKSAPPRTDAESPSPHPSENLTRSGRRRS
jgi:hypothetical protein